MRTESDEYARRQLAHEPARWKRVLDVRRLHRRHLRRQHLGRTLDVGCGVGQNLAVLPPGSVGVDHNPTAVDVARERGFEVYTPDQLAKTDVGLFDGMLVAHVIEHLDPAAGKELMETYVPYLCSGARVFLVCPQERGFAGDPTHICWTTDADLRRLATDVGLVVERSASFPLPRWFGRWFRYNEFHVRARKA